MLIDGREIRDEILESLKEKGETTKRVCFILFKESPEARQFINVKTKVGEKLGLEITLFEKLDFDTEKAISFIKEIVGDFDGIVVQLPLPESMDREEVLNAVPEEKDIDVLSESAKRNYGERKSEMIPPVAGAIKEVLDRNKINPSGKKIVIMGRGKLVGEPAEMLMRQMNASYKTCDINSPQGEVIEALNEADIIITGMGQPHFIKAEMIKEGIVLIDAGTSEDAGELKGDIDPSCEVKASVMTPVPGGIGPITVAILFSNLFKD